MRGKLLILAVAAASFVMLVAAPAAQAGDTLCPPDLTGGTYDNVIVPAGATCTISGATVLGNVKALKGSKLVITDHSQIHGNVEGDRADVVQVLISTVRENIVIQGGGPAAPPVPTGGLYCGIDFIGVNPCEVLILQSTVLEGNIQVENVVGSVLMRHSTVEKGNVTVRRNHIPGPSDTTGEFLAVDRFNVIAQDLRVARNTGSGRKQVTGNTAKQIQCSNNELPFLGGPNAGNASGQCF